MTELYDDLSFLQDQMTKILAELTFAEQLNPHFDGHAEQAFAKSGIKSAKLALQMAIDHTVDELQRMEENEDRSAKRTTAVDDDGLRLYTLVEQEDGNVIAACGWCEYATEPTQHNWEAAEAGRKHSIECPARPGKET